MMSIMLMNTKSSTRVNPLFFLLPQERERDKEVDVESIDNESSEHQKRREGDLAFNCKPLCQSARRCCGGKLGEQYEQHAHKRSAPKSNHECRGAIGEPQEPPQGKLQRRVPPPHPGASGYKREKKKWQCKQWAGKQSPQDGVSGGPKSWTYEVQLSAYGKCKVEDCKQRKHYGARPGYYRVAQVIHHHKQECHPHHKPKGICKYGEGFLGEDHYKKKRAPCLYKRVLRRPARAAIAAAASQKQVRKNGYE